MVKLKVKGATCGLPKFLSEHITHTHLIFLFNELPFHLQKPFHFCVNCSRVFCLVSIYLIN
ncbi:hypothetical protein HanIR_Chr10g0485401 [Helianthus annuus]|nr:hypothetical protein HanIR_Chr10g0485401 [Helianthus annuus]